MFLRKQLGLYIERKTKPRRATDCVRFNLGRLSRFFDWRNALTIVKPDTLIRWHRKGFRLFWKWKSRHRGRPWIPAALQQSECHAIPNNCRIVVTSILGGLHHEYALQEMACVTS
jgi:hypothetical protein